jgi:hypothetical protein
MEVLFAIPPNPTGTHYHRLNIPAAAITKAGFNTFLVDDLAECSIAQLQEYDAVVVSRLITNYPDPMVFDTVAANLKASGVKLIVDIDDIWSIPKHYPGRKAWLQGRVQWLIKSTLTKADQVWCSTLPMVKEARAFLDSVTRNHIEVIHAPNGISQYDAQWSGTPHKMTCPDFRIGLSCNSSHHADIGRLKYPLRQLKRVGGWRLMAIGVAPENQDYVAKQLGMEGSPNLYFRPWLTPYDYATHYAHIDLMLAPLERINYNKYRSDLKIAEAAKSQTPLWCEDFGPYAGTVNARPDWMKAFEHLKDLLVDGDTFALDHYIPVPADHSTDQGDRNRVSALCQLVGTPLKVVTNTTQK